MKKGDRYTAEELAPPGRGDGAPVRGCAASGSGGRGTADSHGGRRFTAGTLDELYVLLDLPHGVTGESRDHRASGPCAVPSGVSGGGRQGRSRWCWSWPARHPPIWWSGGGDISPWERAAAIREELYRDDLTQVFNRRYLNDFVFLRRQMDRLTRVGVIMMDLRRFKEVNDTFGHLAGDRTLEQVARVLGEHVRGQDSVIRLGGDEFVVILLDCGEDIVRRKVEELREALVPVAEADFGYAYTDQFNPSQELLRELLDHADRRMYQEKRRAP